MEIIEYIDKKKEIYYALQDYINDDEFPEDSFKLFTELLEKYKIFEKEEETLDILQILSFISANHCFTNDLFNKIEQIILYIQKDTNSELFDYDFFEIFKSSKKFLLYLLSRKLINIEDHQNEIKKLFPSTTDIFNKKVMEGKNDSYICTLIQNDSVEEFIKYVNQANINLTSRVPYSEYELNPLLSNSTIFQYAAFYGAIQIIQYLKNSHVNMPPSLWRYAIHSNNADLIHLLEDCKLVPDDPTFSYSLIESIQCHHMEIANYILYQYRSVNYELEFGRNIIPYIFRYRYYPFYPSEVGKLFNHPKNSFGFLLSDFYFPDVKKITIPSFVTMIFKEFFEKNNKFEQVLFKTPSSVVLIENNAFKDFSFLTEITIPSSMKMIGFNAFKNCISMKRVLFEKPSSLVSIGANAFNGCSSLVEIEIPSSVKAIDDSAFDGCESLEKVTFEAPSSLTSIGSSLFKGCKSLKQISIPSSITRIGTNAFKKCTSLIEISFDHNSSLTTIDSNAFDQCSSLIKFQMPKSLISIGNGNDFLNKK
ncbi:hypothetical protein M9Y10_006879 [Tritrichomonas musculus]|uniref:Surface antigen BspA-like n=1 Tax=Tritrichomonas musculus TaxID=1915356 RepID=A0ABR2JFV0_9EUKA